MGEDKNLILSDEQIQYVYKCIRKWIKIREKEEKKQFGVSQPTPFDLFWQFSADVDHSSLLYRLLKGNEPLPTPPSSKKSFPLFPEAKKYIKKYV